MPIAVLIVAAGRGTRAGTADRGPKQYAALGRSTVLAEAVRPFLEHHRVDTVQVVIHADDGERYESATAALDSARLVRPVTGGPTRQASVLAGLEAIAERSPRCVLIHDAARPFVDAATISRVIEALDSHPAALAAVPIADTVKRATEALLVAETVDRAGLWQAQTPQGFRFAEILAAHRAAAHAGRMDFTDDASIAEWAGHSTALVTGSPDNTKITTAEDLVRARRMTEGQLQQTLPMMEPRTGTGFDVHRFAPGDSVWLCGVEIPHVARLDGHSDADVGLHALTDAILGALGDGDIGQHFPPSDMQWKGAASRVFLADAARRVAERGGRIANVDVTILCEAPKISTHRDAMRAAIARVLALDMSRVGVKATTTEGLGFTGRREGIAAMASATIMLPA